MFRRYGILSAITVLFAASALLLSADAAPASLDGDWDGRIATGAGSLRVVFRIETKDGAAGGVLLSPDQGNAQIPIGSVARERGTVIIAVPAIQGRFEGTMSGDGKTLSGTWTQGTVALPLTLARRGPDAAPVMLHTAPPLPQGIIERDVSLDTGAGNLSGTLSYAGDKPSALAVLIIAGSGPTDRDGNSAPFDLHPDTYLRLARGLAQHGITALRTDKRGVAASAGALHAESDLTADIYAADYKAWAKLLKSRTGARCVWLAGHSEGSLLAELVAQDNSDICGLILLSGPGRRLSEVLRSQLSTLPDAPRKRADDAIDALASGRTVDAPAGDRLFRPSVQPLWISEFALDPAALLKRLTIPVLIVQGDADRQVLVIDAKTLAAARPDAKLLIVPGMIHDLKPGSAADGALAPGLVDTIADFMASHRA